MSIMRFLGYMLIAIPFIGIAVLSDIMVGPLQTIGIFTLTATVLVIVRIGIELIDA